MPRLKKAFIPVKLLLIIFLVGCQNNDPLNQTKLNNGSQPGTLNEGPNSTGALKEGPNSTGALKDRYILLTRKINGVENPLTPEAISSIEIVSKNNSRSIKNIDITQDKTMFTTKADDLEVTVIFEGSGNFIIRFNKAVSDLDLKFNLKDVAEPAIIPMLSGLTENNLRAVIETGADGKLTVSGGTKKDSGELDASKAMFTIKTDQNGRVVISFINPDGNNEEFFLDKLEESIKNGTLISPEKVEKISDLAGEQKNIEVNVQKLSTMAAYVGGWVYQGLGKELRLDIVDQGSGRFSGNLNIDGTDYNGNGTYQPDASNPFLYIDSSYHNSPIRIKIELLSPNTLGFTLVEVTDQDLINYKGIRLTLNRKLN